MCECSIYCRTASTGPISTDLRMPLSLRYKMMMCLENVGMGILINHNSKRLGIKHAKHWHMRLASYLACIQSVSSATSIRSTSSKSYPLRLASTTEKPHVEIKAFINIAAGKFNLSRLSRFDLLYSVSALQSIVRHTLQSSI